MMRYRIRTGVIAVFALLALTACQPEDLPPPQLVTFGPSGSASLPGPEAITSRTITPPATSTVATGPSVKVGLLLPLTGHSAELGKAMQDAATVSLFDKYARLSGRQMKVKVQLLPKDTGDTPEQAAKAMQEAINEGAEIIIGPVFADATEAAAPIARAKGIPVLSLSNNTQRGGRGVYMFGFSPQEQTVRVMDYAVGTGTSRIAAMIPDTPLGNLVLDAARKYMAAHGMALVKEVKYSSQGVGIDDAANALAGPSGVPNFDAILLPEGTAALSTVLRSLSARGISTANVRLLGTGIWDDASLIRQTPLEGAWLASSPPADTAAFENRFLSTYRYPPPRIASLAYDAVALVVTLAASGRGFDEATLTQPAGFSGPANGVFRLKKDGKTERGLAVLQVQGPNFLVVSPAPPGFSQ